MPTTPRSHGRSQRHVRVCPGTRGRAPRGSDPRGLVGVDARAEQLAGRGSASRPDERAPHVGGSTRGATWTTTTRSKLRPTARSVRRSPRRGVRRARCARARARRLETRGAGRAALYLRPGTVGRGFEGGGAREIDTACLTTKSKVPPVLHRGRRHQQARTSAGAIATKLPRPPACQAADKMRRTLQNSSPQCVCCSGQRWRRFLGRRLGHHHRRRPARLRRRFPAATDHQGGLRPWQARRR